MKYKRRIPAGKWHIGFSVGAWRRLICFARKGNPTISWSMDAKKTRKLVRNSVFGIVQNMVFGHRIMQAKVQEPIFILGYWRSGTTFLHELLCCDSRFGFPTSFSCVNPSSFMLLESWLRQHPMAKRKIRRPMDQMEVSLFSPQEDEFALMAMGALSPYSLFYFPSLARDARQILDFGQMSSKEQERWKRTTLRFLKQQTVQQNKPLILKSPAHGFRIRPLLELFPDARFILIERNPFDVFASNLIMLEAMMTAFSHEEFDRCAIEKFVLDGFKLHDQAINDSVPDIPPGQFARLEYDELVAHPFETIQKIYATVGLGAMSESYIEKLNQYLHNVKNYQGNTLRLTSDQRLLIENAWSDILHRASLGDVKVQKPVIIA